MVLLFCFSAAYRSSWKLHTETTFQRIFAKLDFPPQVSAIFQQQQQN